MKKRFWMMLILVALAAMLLPQTVLANSPPMPPMTPFTKVRFTGYASEGFYATLLSRDSVSGSASAYDEARGNAAYAEGDPDYEIWRKFAAYADSDGYYFLQKFWRCTGHGSFRWEETQPESFKILLYFPKTDSFAVSKPYETYSLYSNYVVNLKRADTTATAPRATLVARKDADYAGEIMSFAGRVLLTIAIELAIALLFGYHAIKQIAFIATVNVITQILLNAILLVANLWQNLLVFMGACLAAELLVFTIEAVVYFRRMQKYSPKPIKRGLTILYAFVANLASLVGGVVFATWYYFGL